MKNNIVNYYLVFGTLPCLYAQTNLFHDKKKSYMWARSSGTFDYKNAPENLAFYKKIEGSDYHYYLEYIDLITEHIKELVKKDSKIEFNIFIDDNRLHFFLKPFIKANAIDRISQVTILNEGNGSLDMFATLNDDLLLEAENKWNILIDKIKDDTINLEEYIFLENFCFWYSMKKNVKFLLPFPDLLVNKNISTKFKKKMNLESFDLESHYMRIDEKKRRLVFNLSSDFLNFPEETYIIIGTYNFGFEELTTLFYKDLISQLLEDEKMMNYSFYYKGHPLFPVNTNSEFGSFLVSRNIKTLPEKMPIELLLWENEKIVIGGFCSTINAFISPKRTKSIFGKLIGYPELLLKNGNLNFKKYNIELSQPLAASLIKISGNITKNLNDKFTELSRWVDILDKELTRVKTDFYILQNKYNKITKPFRIITKPFRKLKKK